MEGTLYRIVFPRSSSYDNNNNNKNECHSNIIVDKLQGCTSAAYSSCLGLLYILEYLIVTLVRFVLLLLLFNFVMHCIISTVVVAFEMNYLSKSLNHRPSVL